MLKLLIELKYVELQGNKAKFYLDLVILFILKLGE